MFRQTIVREGLQKQTGQLRYDDYRVISETLYPPLTTMELPYGRMGEAAARLMLGELRGDEPMQAGTSVAVKGELRWRASVTGICSSM